MGSDFDTALQATAAAEATYNGSVTNVATIETSITQATEPLAPAQAKLVTDQAAYVAQLLNLVTIEQAIIAALSPAAPPPAPGA